MRYRRLSYRYAVITQSNDPWAAVADRPGVSLAQTTWRPAADMYETETLLVVVVELAGVDPEDVEVLLFEDALVIEGLRRLPPVESAIYHRVEIRQGTYRLELPLPVPSDMDSVDATYERGLLQIILQKTGTR